jgi:mono/diheme cytochrome c family protein
VNSTASLSAALLVFLACPSVTLSAQNPTAPAAHALTSGEAIYQAGCAGCHGATGQGAPATSTMFDRPETFPDFTDCAGTTPELDIDWKATIALGGHGRGFSRIMPVFVEELTSTQIDAVIKYLRTFCRSDRYPRGELNLPRPLITEKAFPESEAILTVGLPTNGSTNVESEFSYEHRLSARNQLEIAVPFSSVRDENGVRASGVGDVAVGLKRVLFASHDTIVSGFGEIALPSGNSDKGLGSGVTTFSFHAMAGQILPGEAFLQAQVGTDQPVNPDLSSRTIFWRLNAGKSFRQDGGLGRMWSPMIEVVGDRAFGAGELMTVDLVPQMQVTLSRRLHVRANAGLQIPVSNREGRPKSFVFYVLWDWFDGGLFDGWR